MFRDENSYDQFLMTYGLKHLLQIQTKAYGITA